MLRRFYGIGWPKENELSMHSSDNIKVRIATHGVNGINAHEARLVAAMRQTGLTDLSSFKEPDFARFTAANRSTLTEVVNGQIPA